MNIRVTSLKWSGLSSLVACGVALCSAGCGAATAPFVDDFGDNSEAPGADAAGGADSSTGGMDGGLSKGGSDSGNSGSSDAGADSSNGGMDGGLSEAGSDSGNSGSSDAGAGGGPDSGSGSGPGEGGCTGDSQCPDGDICDTKAGDANQGSCVPASAAGCNAGQSDAVCPLNAADECCAGSCYPGNCCIVGGAASGCTGASISCAPDQSGETLGGGVCTVCPAVVGPSPVYYVDPVRGSDPSGTGNNSTFAQCALRTITRALEIIGSSPQPNTTINVVGGTTETGVVTITGVSAGTAAGGQELFPLIIGSNLTVTTSMGPVVVEVPASAGGAVTTGFVLEGSPSAIAGGAGAALTIDGQMQTAGIGVSVQSSVASLSSVTIQNFAENGIEVSNAGNAASALAIGAGLQSNGNGTDGLFVTGSSTATITAQSGAPIQFNANGAHGARVTETGVLTLTGNLGAVPPSSATLVAKGNGEAGIWVQTTAGTQSTITGVVSTGSTGGNGIRIIPGSNVKVRGCWVLGNSHGSGIDVENVAGGTVATVARIDLGSRSSAGANVLQAVSGANQNGEAGICLKLPGESAAVLDAQGNFFQGNVNCATMAHVLETASGNACAAGADVGGTIAAFPGGVGDTIDVGACSYE